MTRSWHGALDDFESHLAAQQAAFDAGSDPVGDFNPPADLGPLPNDLRPRAEALLTQVHELTAAVADRAAAVQSDLDRLPRRLNTVPASAPQHLDARS